MGATTPDSTPAISETQTSVVQIEANPEPAQPSESYTNSRQTGSVPVETNEQTTPEVHQEVPQQIINIAEPMSGPAPIVEAPSVNPLEVMQAPDPIVEPLVSKSPETPEEAPSPFSEDSYSSPSTYQTPAPTDVSAVANIASANTTAAAPGPVIVIAAPKRRQTGRTRKIPSSSNGVPRKRRVTKPRQSVQNQTSGSRSSIGSTSSLSDDNSQEK